MKSFVTFFIVALVAFGGYYLAMGNTEKTTIPVESELSLVDVTPVSHASFVLSWAGETIYADPVGGASAFKESVPPDLILITDIHGDHLDIPTLESIVATQTTIVAPAAVEEKLPAALKERTIVIGNGDTTLQKGFVIEAIPMYNVPETSDSRHPKGRGNGYVVSRDDTKVYIAGDTGDTPEMRTLKDIDIAFVPMNLPYTMSVASAAEGVLAFAPSKVYPYHYRGQDGLSDVEQFKRLLNEGNANIEVVLAEWYPSASPAASTTDSDVVVDMTGKNMVFSETEIKVKKGDTVTINFKSEGGTHDWVVDEFKAATARVKDGEMSSVTFVAETSGEFEFYCSVGQHREHGMVGTLLVE